MQELFDEWKVAYLAKGWRKITPREEELFADFFRWLKSKAAEHRVQSDECEACRDKSYITLGNGNVICWYCGRIRH